VSVTQPTHRNRSVGGGAVQATSSVPPDHLALREHFKRQQVGRDLSLGRRCTLFKDPVEVPIDSRLLSHHTCFDILTQRRGERRGSRPSERSARRNRRLLLPRRRRRPSRGSCLLELPRGLTYSDAKVEENRNDKGFGWAVAHEAVFATPADLPRHDCSPYSHEHVRRERLGVVPRSRTISCRPVPNPCMIRNFLHG
jgi:hypothetical protein